MYDVLGEGFSFTEAPRWHDGALWFSDFFKHTVYRWDGSVFHPVCHVPGRPSGLGFSPAGELMVVSMVDRKLLRLHDGSLEVLAELSEHCPGLANDMWVDAVGRAYIGNDGLTRPLQSTVLLRRDPDGSVVVAADDLVVPNGIIITPDGTELFVAESFAGRVSAYEVRKDGSLTNRRSWVNLAPPRPFTSLAEARQHSLLIPDGITLDAHRNLWIADAAGSGVWCFAEGGRVVDHLDTGPYTAYSAVLGGSDGKTLFVTAGPPLDDIKEDGTEQAVILAAQVNVPAAHF
ncbi:SMP-30/gluconolactonase/LRE family protein [Mycolicibacterium komossense]|uniref:SMP-30/gluconolactonase/LRE family protein n=1 Tax=Mycolicibacterium komossense TaxID=1779 RepID=A0ABT3CJ16_9MYCO|nr:SMP-30/gluconolactonase/LRE family protein [Mycolicibacterium komossense]MCV7229478.1 SMP-30/gluconolactonase/LRE family protein [Mycolicibacterium komossense]